MIYLDHAAFTPVEAVARSAIDRALASEWGNPDSLHAAGRRARALVEQAIVQIAEYLGCLPSELRVHANATSALRCALHAAASCTRGPLVGSRIDHPMLVHALDELAATGREVRWIALRAGHAAPTEWQRVLSDAAV